MPELSNNPKGSLREAAHSGGGGRLSPLNVVRGLGLRRVLDLLWSVLAGKRRSASQDARMVVSLMDPPPRAEGLHHVPPCDPFVLVGNHLEAPGLWVGWVAAAITAALSRARAPGCQELRWVVLSEWRWFEAFGRWFPQPVTSLLFPRAVQVWGMIAMPARPSDVSGRARALRQILAQLRSRPGARPSKPEPVGIFPEGTATLALQEAKPGTGALLHRICRTGVPILPVGTFLHGNLLTIRFGQPFLLGDPPAEAGGDLDSWARREIMVAVGRLLPEHLWGTYASSISSKP